MKWLKQLFQRKPRPIHQIDLNGVDGFVMIRSADGRKVTVSGWNNRHWQFEAGHLAQLITKRTPAGNYGGTYRIDNVKHCGDPPDMYFIDCTFVGAQG